MTPLSTWPTTLCSDCHSFNSLFIPTPLTVTRTALLADNTEYQHQRNATNTQDKGRTTRKIRITIEWSAVTIRVRRTAKSLGGLYLGELPPLRETNLRAVHRTQHNATNATGTKTVSGGTAGKKNNATPCEKISPIAPPIHPPDPTSIRRPHGSVGNEATTRHCAALLVEQSSPEPRSSLCVPSMLVLNRHTWAQKRPDQVRMKEINWLFVHAPKNGDLKPPQTVEKNIFSFYFNMLWLFLPIIPAHLPSVPPSAR